MTTLTNYFQENYNNWHVGQNPDVDAWFLMDNPGVILGLLLTYLLFVLRIGPSFMQNRQPMELKNALIAYNGLQVLFSAWLVYKCFIVLTSVGGIFSSSCTTNNSQVNDLINQTAWYYFIAKLTEFMDTVFFVLRKRTRQVTFLHVYHHSITMFFSWCYLKYTPGEQGVIVGSVNSGVHVVMYFYYMVSAMGPQYQKYIWWKKYMTMIQLVQFGVIIAYLSFLLVSKCGHSRGLTYFFMLNTVVFIYLFIDFYRKAYEKSSPKKVMNGLSNNNASNMLEEEEMISKKYLHDERYAQISKDAPFLNQDEIRKRE